MMLCPTCSSEVPAGARFCPSCGTTTQAQTDQRRVATVLFADLVGFTTLAEAMDPEQLKNLIDGCFEVLVAEIEAFGGRVDKIIGDAIVALFGAPVAHGDDAERAVRAGLRLHQVLAEHTAPQAVAIQMRVGVNTGEVLVGSLRAGGDYTAMGDVVNVAQRLETLANPGEVLVGPATYAATEAVIEYEPLGPVSVRNREEPVDGWRAVTARTLPGRRPHRARTPFVGRAEELSLAEAAIDLAVGRLRPLLFTVTGEAGVGKRRICAELAMAAETRHGALVLEGRCVPYGEANPLFPVAEAMRHALGITLGSDDDQSRLRDALAELLECDPLEPEVMRTADGLLALFALSGPLDLIDPQRAREETTRAVLVVVTWFARTRPVVLSVSDLQWADDRLIELLAFVLERVGPRPVIVLLTSRSVTDIGATASGRELAVAMHLDPLDADSARSLLDHLLGDELDEAERGQLLDRSGGNPLFLEEFAAVVGAGGEAGELPDTLRGLVTARLDRLAPPERAMLDNAAVLGSSGPVFALLEFGRALGQAPSRDALTHLMMLDLLDVRDERWSFVSESVREVAYTTLTKAVRARRHVALAQAIERRDAKGLVEQIAAHLASAAELAGDIGDVEGVPRDVADQAVSWLTRAADRAAVAGSPLASARLARRALALLSPGDDRRPELLLAEARGLTDVHRVGEARTLLDEIVAGDAGDRVQASARTLMATIEELFGNFETAARLGDDAVARWRTIGDDAGLAEALRVRGLTSIMDLDPPKAEGFLTESRLLAASAGDRRAVAWADQHLAWLAFVTGDLELADRRIAAAAATFDELGDRGGEGWALGLSAWVRFQEGRFEQAEELATKVRLEAQDRGDRWGTAMMVLLLANLELWRGRSRAAAGLAAQAHATFRSLGDRHSQLLALAPLSRANVAVGDLDSVRRFTEESASLGTQIGNAHLGEVIVAGAEAHAGLGHHHQSLAEFEPIGVSAREAPASWALLALQDGDGERARLLLDHPGARGAYADSVRALALCATGEIDEARRAADAAVIEPGVTYLDVVIASLARACALARAGSTDLALAALVEARVGADATDDKVAQLLVRLAELEVRLAATLPSDDLIWFVDERIADLGADPAGWRRAIRLALGSSVGAVAPDRG